MILELFVFFVAMVVIGGGLVAGYRRMSKADAGLFQPLAGGGREPLRRGTTTPDQDLESQPTSYGIQTSPFEVIYDNGRQESLSSGPSSPTSVTANADSSVTTNYEHYALESPSARFLKFKFPLQSEDTILDFENADVKNLFNQITATAEDEVPRSPIPHRDSAKSLFSEDLDDDDYHDSPYATHCIDKYDLALTAAKPMLKVN